MKSKNLMFAGALVLGILVIGVIAAAGITGYQIRLFKGQKATLPDGSTLERIKGNNFVVTPGTGSSPESSSLACNFPTTPPKQNITYFEKKNNVDYHRYVIVTKNCNNPNGRSYVLRFNPRQDVGGNRNETDVYNLITGKYEATELASGDSVSLGDNGEIKIQIMEIGVYPTEEYVKVMTVSKSAYFKTPLPIELAN